MTISIGEMELLLRLRGVETSSPVGAEAKAIQFPHGILLDARYQVGTGALKVGAYWSKRFTSSQDIDLRGTLLSVADGVTVVSFPLVTTFCIVNRSSTAGENLVIGADGSAPFVSWLGGTAPTVGPIGPGGCLLVHNPNAGYAVTDTSADILQVAVSSGTPTWDIFIAGRDS